MKYRLLIAIAIAIPLMGLAAAAAPPMSQLRTQARAIVGALRPCIAAMAQHAHVNLDSPKALNEDANRLLRACTAPERTLRRLTVSASLVSARRHAHAALVAALSVWTDDGVLAQDTIWHKDADGVQATLAMIVDQRTFWREGNAAVTAVAHVLHVRVA